jgi:hypothetical protein
MIWWDYLIPGALLVSLLINGPVCVRRRPRP